MECPVSLAIFAQERRSRVVEGNRNNAQEHSVRRTSHNCRTYINPGEQLITEDVFRMKYRRLMLRKPPHRIIRFDYTKE